VVVWWRWWSWVSVGLIVNLVERSFLYLLLLAKDIDSILQLYELHPLSIDVLPTMACLLMMDSYSC
jgi:hypothetical protein